MSHTSVYVILLTCLLYKSCQAAGGTTRGIKEVFIGRCWQYRMISDRKNIDVLKVNINCTELWSAFHQAVAFKDPCKVTKKDYKKVFQVLYSPKKITNALFWSGLHQLVTDFAFVNENFIVLEDTITGYLFNNLNWCGSVTSPDGFNYTKCDSSCDTTTPLWALASSEFADQASGTTQVLLNATRANNKNAYANGSFFRTYEMPRLKVDKLTVYLASSIGKEAREKCEDSISMKNIRNDASKRKIEIKCVDQPKLVLRIYCLKYPKAKECTTNSVLTGEKNSDDSRTWEILALVFCILFTLLLLGIMSWLVRQHLKKNRMAAIATKPVAMHQADSVVVNKGAVLWKTVCLILVAVVAVLILYILVSVAHRAICRKSTNFKHAHSWSFSKKPMLQNDELYNNNEEDRIV